MALLRPVPTPHKDAPPREQLYAPIEWQAGRRVRGHRSTSGPRRSPGSRSTGPRCRNAFRPQTLAELRDAFTRARDDTEVGAIIFTGAGGEAFCSGGDQRIRGDDGYIGDDEVAQQGVGRLDVGDLHVQIRRAAEAGARGGRRLRGRRRPDPAPGLRPLDRRRQRRSSARPGPASAASTAASAPACWRARSGSARRRRSGSCAASTPPTRRSRWGSSTRSSRSTELERESVAWCREMTSLSPLSLRLLKSSFNAAEDGLTGLQQLSHDATLLFYMTEEGQEGRDSWKRGPPRPTSRSSRSDLDGTPTLRMRSDRWRRIWADGGPAADAAGGDRAGAGRQRRGGYEAGDDFRWGAFVAALIGSIFIQIGTNLANDYSDAKRGRRHRRPARPGAGHLRRAGGAAARPLRDLARVRRRRGRRHLPGHRRRAGDPRGRRRLDPRRRPLHGRPAPLRLRRAWASCSSSCSSAWSPSTAPTTSSSSGSTGCRSGSRSRSGCSRPRSWSSTTSATSRPTAAPASGRSRCGSGASAPGRLYVVLLGGAFVVLGDRPGRRRRAGLAALLGAARGAARLAAAAGRARRAPTARR